MHPHVCLAQPDAKVAGLHVSIVLHGTPTVEGAIELISSEHATWQEPQDLHITRFLLPPDQ